VTDRKIRAAIAAGASTVTEVGERTQAGVECGTCHPGIAELLREATHPESPAQLAAGRPKERPDEGSS
jgi:bacterioferritin-associated ferredoxin